MLEEMYYYFMLANSKEDEILDFQLSSEFNAVFLSALRRCTNHFKRNYFVNNITLDYDFAISIYTNLLDKKLVVVYNDLTNSITFDNPSKKIFDLLEESFGDYTANVTYGGKNVH